MVTTQRRLSGLVSCDECPTPAYRIVGQTVVIEHRHDGKKHVTVVDLAQILDKMRRSSTQ